MSEPWGYMVDSHAASASMDGERVVLHVGSNGSGHAIMIPPAAVTRLRDWLTAALAGPIKPPVGEPGDGVTWTGHLSVPVDEPPVGEVDAPPPIGSDEWYRRIVQAGIAAADYVRSQSPAPDMVALRRWAVDRAVEISGPDWYMHRAEKLAAYALTGKVVE